jgi:hypothetical protein
MMRDGWHYVKNVDDGKQALYRQGDRCAWCEHLLSASPTLVLLVECRRRPGVDPDAEQREAMLCSTRCLVEFSQAVEARERDR